MLVGHSIIYIYIYMCVYIYIEREIHRYYFNIGINKKNKKTQHSQYIY